MYEDFPEETDIIRKVSQIACEPELDETSRFVDKYLLQPISLFDIITKPVKLESGEVETYIMLDTENDE